MQSGPHCIHLELAWWRLQVHGVLRVLAQRQLHGIAPNARTIAGDDLDVARVFGPHVLMFRGLGCATHLEQRRRCQQRAPRHSLSSQQVLPPLVVRRFLDPRKMRSGVITSRSKASTVHALSGQLMDWSCLRRRPNTVGSAQIVAHTGLRMALRSGRTASSNSRVMSFPP